MRGATAVPMLAIIAGMVLVSSAVLAQTGDPEPGRRLAVSDCSDCHAIDGRTAAGKPGPSFAAVAQMMSTTSLSLHVFLQTPHEKMPDYQLTARQIDDIVAYILGLRRAQ